MERQEIRLKCIDLAMSIQAQREAGAVIEQAKILEKWVAESDGPIAVTVPGQPTKPAKRQY